MSETCGVSAVLVRGLGRRIGSARLLADVSFSVPYGALLALVGPNGAGKTTLLSLLAGDDEPDEGEVRLLGRAVGDYSHGELARARAVLPQQTLLQFSFTSREVVSLGRHPYPSASPAEDARAVAEAMADTDTTALASRRYPTLSGGEQSRVSLARVLAQRTPVLLLDEPTANLDVQHQHSVLTGARTLADGGCTLVMAVHDLNLAAAYADLVLVLDGGRVAASGPPAVALDAALLSKVLSHDVTVVEHPRRGCPLVLM